MALPITVRTRKFMRNSLMKRRQMVIDVIHQGKPNVSKADLREQIVKSHNVKDPKCVFLFGFRTKFGGGKSTGFGIIYDTLADAKKFEPKHRLIQAGMGTKTETSRKGIKETKNRGKKVFGTGVRLAKKKAKRAAAQE